MARLLLFASAREAAGCRHATFDGVRLSDVLSSAETQFGELFSQVLSYSTVLVDGEQAKTDVTVHGETEIAILPPVSGGVR